MAAQGDIHQRLSRVEGEVESIWEFQRTISEIVSGHTTRLENIERTLRAHSAQFVVIGERFDRIDARLDQMDQRFDQMFTFFGIPPGGASQN